MNEQQRLKYQNAECERDLTEGETDTKQNVTISRRMAARHHEACSHPKLNKQWQYSHRHECEPRQWLNGLVVSALESRTRVPVFESRIVPLFHWAATLGKLLTHKLFTPVSQLQETGVQKGSFQRLSDYGVFYTSADCCVCVLRTTGNVRTSRLLKMPISDPLTRRWVDWSRHCSRCYTAVNSVASIRETTWSVRLTARSQLTPSTTQVLSADSARERSTPFVESLLSASCGREPTTSLTTAALSVNWTH